jgi:glycosyltransferase involved in cell wall biosynthesis
MQPPRVSIGLPVFNGEKYLEQTLDSILAQTYTDFEVVIADNASTDQTAEICQAYAARDARLRYFRNDENIGAAPNHNHVFALSRGVYFKWSGYDDLIGPEFLARCVEVLDQHPDVVLCIPKSKIIDENGVIVGDHEYAADATLPTPHQRFVDFVRNPDTGNHTYGLMRADVIRKTSLHGSYPSSDLVFLAELTLYGRFYVIPERLFSRRRHEKQSTVGALQSERSRVLWFDTALADKIVLPKWQYLFGYLKAIRRAPLTMSQRAHCYATIVRWALLPQHARAMIKDLLLALDRLSVRAWRRALSHGHSSSRGPEQQIKQSI